MRNTEQKTALDVADPLTKPVLTGGRSSSESRSSRSKRRSSSIERNSVAVVAPRVGKVAIVVVVGVEVVVVRALLL